VGTSQVFNVTEDGMATGQWPMADELEDPSWPSAVVSLTTLTMLDPIENSEMIPTVAGSDAFTPTRRSLNSPWKVCLDTVVASILLTLSVPLILVLIVLVRLTSRGPGLYRQVRLGLGGRPFVLYKIRTMAHDCERSSGPKWSTPGDPRVTRLGWILRRTHLDELPQLWNVVCGEMSLVGPRPERPEFVSQLEPVLPRYRERLTVRPGVTGLAQVQLPPDEDLASVRRKLACDLYYIARMSPWLDARIIMATALKLAAVPFDVIRRCLLLPGPNVPGVETMPAGCEGETVNQLQTA
jgi:lipopolysaccharide/colanic/teichoic acid biosynthesis glycosyltransferase